MLLKQSIRNHCSTWVCSWKFSWKCRPLFNLWIIKNVCRHKLIDSIMRVTKWESWFIRGIPQIILKLRLGDAFPLRWLLNRFQGEDEVRSSWTSFQNDTFLSFCGILLFELPVQFNEIRKAYIYKKKDSTYIVRSRCAEDPFKTWITSSPENCSLAAVIAFCLDP